MNSADVPQIVVFPQRALEHRQDAEMSSSSDSSMEMKELDNEEIIQKLDATMRPEPENEEDNPVYVPIPPVQPIPPDERFEDVTNWVALRASRDRAPSYVMNKKSKQIFKRRNRQSALDGVLSYARNNPRLLSSEIGNAVRQLGSAMRQVQESGIAPVRFAVEEVASPNHNGQPLAIEYHTEQNSAEKKKHEQTTPVSASSSSDESSEDEQKTPRDKNERYEERREKRREALDEYNQNRGPRMKDRNKSDGTEREVRRRRRADFSSWTPAGPKVRVKVVKEQESIQDISEMKNKPKKVLTSSVRSKQAKKRPKPEKSPETKIRKNKTRENKEAKQNDQERNDSYDGYKTS